MARIGFGYIGKNGDLDVRLENGEIVIVVRDQRGLNTRTAGVTLRNERLVDLGKALIQIGEGASLDEVDVGRANRTTETA